MKKYLAYLKDPEIRSILWDIARTAGELIIEVRSMKGDSQSVLRAGFVPYGGQKKDGSHDHRYNKGSDRTPAQKEGDRRRSES